MGHVIELEGAAKRYDGGGAPALGPVSLAVGDGEAVAVTGPSGSGKSTLLNLVAGLDRPSSGAVTVAGDRLDRLGEGALARFRRHRIGFVFQFFNLLDDLTVAANVRLPAELAGMPRRKASARAAELLETLGVGGHADAYPGGCRAGSASGSRSPVRWSTARRCCSPTSRPARWTPRRDATSATCSPG
nr:ATP-binding cassette domain-containing protein [Actinomadura sp. J1-007]